MELASLFPSANETQWRQAVERVLKGADFEKTMVGKTVDGLVIAPLSPRKIGAKPLWGKREASRWAVSARLADPDVARGNALLHEDLAGGADQVVLSFAGAYGARGFGLRDHSPAALDGALKGVHVDLVRLRLETSPFGARSVAESVEAYARLLRLPPATLHVDFGFSPLADHAVKGQSPRPFTQEMKALFDLIHHLEAEGFRGAFLRLDSRPFADAGASEAQELASLLAQGVAYLRAAQARGLSLDHVRNWLSFTLSVDDDQFMSLAKVRALRLLWQEVERVLKIPHQAIDIHAETSWRMMSARDVYTNVLRTTIATFAAGVGGADSIEVLPFTSVLGLPDAAARRLARNTGLILLDESGLYRVKDPACGAGSIEALTEEIAAKAWALFQTLETVQHEGEKGFSAALDKGFFAHWVRETREQRTKLIATRRLPITGVSEFPDLKEAPVHLLETAPKLSFSADFAPHRLAEAFEALRDRADEITRKRGKGPLVFMANLGRVADFTARTTFAKNFLEAGGLETLGNDGFADAAGQTDIAALVAAYQASNAPYVCLASSDAVYFPEEGVSLAIEAARALMKAGAKQVLLAGRAGAHEAALQEAGVSTFLYVGAHLLTTLDALLSQEALRSGLNG